MTNRTKQPDSGEVRESCIALRMRLANRVITKIYDDALRPFGVRIPQMALLALAEERGLLRQSEICSELKLDDSTLSRNLERMKSNGWLVEVAGEDAREHPYQLTVSGRNVLLQALPAWQAAQQQAGELLGKQGVETLRRFAAKQGLR